MTDTTLVQRLRERVEFMGGRLVTTIDGHIMHQAADEIDRLTAELAEARKGISEPDLLSMSSGIIQLHYEDLDAAQTAFDWLETFLASKGE